MGVVNKLANKKHIWCVLLALGSFGLGFFHGQILEHKKGLKVEEELRIAVADLEIRNNELSDKNAIILAKNAELDATNDQLIQERNAIGTQLAKANDDLDALRSAEPVYPELESHPLVVNLRLQLKAQDTRYSLAMEDIKKANEVIGNQRIQIVGLEQAYQNALQMYLNSDKILNDSLRMNAQLKRTNTLYKRVATYEGIALVAVILFSLVS